MSGWKRIVSVVGAARVITALGALAVVLASGRVFLSLGNDTLVDVLGLHSLIILPGLVMLVGGYRLPETDLHPDSYTVVLERTLTGAAAMLGLAVVLAVTTGLNRPVFTPLVTFALGGAAGFFVGFNEARAVTRAEEAEQRSRELERTKAELEKTVEQLRTSNERLEQFAYAASHDLQEPLRMVSSYLQLLENRYEDSLDAEAREYIDFAVDGADRMRAMVESLLEYSRVSRGEPLEPTDADAILEDALVDLQVRIEETDATVTADDLPTVQGDGDQLALVFRNLIANAIEYSGDEPPRVHISAERDDDMWRFSVADEGIGIAPEYHDRIFNVFEQVHAGEGAAAGAGGVGLAVCERIVERHGGDIWVESQPGEGATFHFTTPVPETPVDDQPAPTADS
ncbi:MAG: ATP-binding protein [Halolamina sp.]